MAKNQLNDTTTQYKDKLLTLPQYLIPQHFLSVIMHKITQSECVWFKNAFIRFICWKFKVNLAEASSDKLADYSSFNAFFTRSLKDGVHIQAEGEQMVTSPVDGAISHIGQLQQGQIIQAKGREYSVEELLGGDTKLASFFTTGQFATIYLSPKDYHRIHMPLSGKLTKMRYIPGKLFSVNPRTARAVPKLFARNERLVTVFDTEQGPIVLVLVGAIFVGSMETVWEGQITPPYSKDIRDWHYGATDAPVFEKGEEIARFNMGSTVVMLLPSTMAEFQHQWQAEMPIRLGQALN